jgi:flavin reductase (DIM6/NTAB) family NADH-FMN oxidoreductase RutF
VLVCADKTSDTYAVIAEAGCFAVNVLSAGQQELSNRFASKKDEHRRFEGLHCETGSTGCARIPGAIAWLDCTVQQTVDAGDHLVHIGLVESAEVSDRAPLIYFRQGYRKIA